MDFKNFFQHPKGGPFGSKKSNLALVGQNLHSRKNLQKQISFKCVKVPTTEPAPLHVDYRNTLVESMSSRVHPCALPPAPRSRRLRLAL